RQDVLFDQRVVDVARFGGDEDARAHARRVVIDDVPARDQGAGVAEHAGAALGIRAGGAAGDDIVAGDAVVLERAVAPFDAQTTADIAAAAQSPATGDREAVDEGAAAAIADV